MSDIVSLMRHGAPTGKGGSSVTIPEFCNTASADLRKSAAERFASADGKTSAADRFICGFGKIG